MATHPANEAPLSAPVELQNRHRRALTRLYDTRVEANLFQLCWLESHGVEAHARGQFTFWGLFDAERELQAAALDLAGRLVMVEAHDPSRCSEFGAFFLRRGTYFQHIVSRRACAEAFWRTYSAESSVQARLIQHQQLYVLTPAELAGGGEPSGLRRARQDELEAIFLASARMHREETLEDPLERDPEGFRRHVRYRIENGRTFSWFDDRRLLFKADISTRGSLGAQISGVYTDPLHRNQGIATRAMRDLCALLFAQGLPRITLYVNESNEAACRVYRRVGFRYCEPYQTVFIAD
ncbi:GNAT family N-acetyltransferase [Lujinxingia vulgaris]|uniref:GNAT family N-acetyltransferase n=1 Tax=Lujinxingia vulgaris TaxID=2600176 RepID=A0A5C6XNS5_9DELT|nr:GNAT family N-acetyltransferase [Lujinxingia vulgaris]TXD39049.1 GNAT family N-acetyltransferase [Lujinxingia vulgaris]